MCLDIRLGLRVIQGVEQGCELGWGEGQIFVFWRYRAKGKGLGLRGSLGMKKRSKPIDEKMNSFNELCGNMAMGGAGASFLIS